MSRSGYDDGCDYERLGLYRQAVERAIRGRRGQAFLREMLAALDALPEKRLAAGVLVCSDGCCAMGAVGEARGLAAEMSRVDEAEPYEVARLLGIATSMAAEIAYINDGEWTSMRGTDEQRFVRVRRWVESQIRSEP